MILRLTKVDEGRALPASLSEVCDDARRVILGGCAAVEELERCALQSHDCESHWQIRDDLATLSPKIWALNVLSFAENLEFREASLERG